MNTKIKINLPLLLGISVLTSLFTLFPARAQELSSDIIPSETDNQSIKIFPHEQTFIITAYYSPIEGQKHYIRGSLAADKKLNGNGVHGADGTPVYPGMIAAPKSVPFGTKMTIPGIGTVAVHDRGGAIVPAGQRGHAYDRLDVWMGYGDEGLNRALRWGRRTVTAVVYGIDDSIVESIDLSEISGDEISTLSNPVLDISQDFGFGDEDAKITEIKTKLQELKYFTGTIDNKFDESLYQAVLTFQLQNQIVDNEDDFGAGFFGPQTRRMLEKAYQNKEQKPFIAGIAKAKAETNLDDYAENVQLAGNGLTFLLHDLKPGDSGQAVIELQTELNKLNLFGLEPTGYYGEVTAHAVFKFQQSQNLIADKNSMGAGVLGPQTRSKLSDLVNSRIDTRKLVASKPEDNDFQSKK